MSARTTDARNQLLRFTSSTISLDFLSLLGGSRVALLRPPSVCRVDAGRIAISQNRTRPRHYVSGLTRMRASDHLHTDPSPCPNIQVRPTSVLFNLRNVRVTLQARAILSPSKHWLLNFFIIRAFPDLDIFNRISAAFK